MNPLPVTAGMINPQMPIIEYFAGADNDVAIGAIQRFRAMGTNPVGSDTGGIENDAHC